LRAVIDFLGVDDGLVFLDLRAESLLLLAVLGYFVHHLLGLFGELFPEEVEFAVVFVGGGGDGIEGLLQL
jgi:hypothetical protein